MCTVCAHGPGSGSSYSLRYASRFTAIAIGMRPVNGGRLSGCPLPASNPAPSGLYRGCGSQDSQTENSRPFSTAAISTRTVRSGGWSRMVSLRSQSVQPGMESTELAALAPRASCIALNHESTAATSSCCPPELYQAVQGSPPGSRTSNTSSCGRVRILRRRGHRPMAETDMAGTQTPGHFPRTRKRETDLFSRKFSYR